MIKRYDCCTDDGNRPRLREDDVGEVVLFTDHESAIAAKDAEIAELRANLDEAIEHAARGWGLLPLWKDKCQSIAEQVRERCIAICLEEWGARDKSYQASKDPYYLGCADAADCIEQAIRTADLSDISGNNQEVKPNPESVSRDRSANDHYSAEVYGCAGCGWRGDFVDGGCPKCGAMIGLVLQEDRSAGE